MYIDLIIKKYKRKRPLASCVCGLAVHMCRRVTGLGANPYPLTLPPPLSIAQ